MKQTLQFLFAAMLVSLLFVACSKNDDGQDPPQGKMMKFTLKTSNLQASDDIGIIISSGSGTLTNTVFKVNNVVQSNQTTITISKAQLQAGEVVVETTIPVYTVVMGVSGSSATAGHSFIFKISPVIDGDDQTAVTRTIGTNGITENFTF